MSTRAYNYGAHMIQITVHVMRGRPVNTRWLRTRFGVSKATAQRYMHAIEAELPVRAERSARGAVTLLLMPEEG